MSVRWSPDGKRLLFYREGLDIRDGRGRWVQPVYTANAKTGTLKLVDRGIHVLAVRWSPDGGQFAYAGGPVGSKIHIFDLARRRDRTLNLTPCAGEGSCQFVDW